MQPLRFVSLGAGPGLSPSWQLPRGQRRAELRAAALEACSSPVSCVQEPLRDCPGAFGCPSLAWSLARLNREKEGRLSACGGLPDLVQLGGHSPDTCVLGHWTATGPQGGATFPEGGPLGQGHPPAVTLQPRKACCTSSPGPHGCSIPFTPSQGHRPGTRTCLSLHLSPLACAPRSRGEAVA